MIKAALNLLCVTFVLAAPALRAQTGDANTAAVQEAVRRQHDAVELRRELADAQASQQRGDLIEAARLYQGCYDLAQRIGPEVVEAEMPQIMAGRNAVLLQLAAQEQKREDYDQAEDHLMRILAADPHNEAALKAEKENRALLDAQKGTRPSAEVLAQVPIVQSNAVHVAELVQDGRLFYEMGKYDEADAKFKRALELDHANVPAQQYQNLILERRDSEANNRIDVDNKRAIQEVTEAYLIPERVRDLTPRSIPYNRTSNLLVHTSPGRQILFDKLNKIKIDNLNYPGLTLDLVLEDLAKRVAARDPDQKGINFFWSREPTTPAAGNPQVQPDGTLLGAAVPDQPDASSVHVQISLSDVTLSQALDAIQKTADKQIRYSVLDYGIMFALKTPEATPLETRTFHVDGNTFRDGLLGVSSQSFGSSGGGGGGFGGNGGGGGFGGNGGGGGGGGNFGGGGGGNFGGGGGNNGGGNNGGGGGGGSASVAKVVISGGGGGGAGGSNGAAGGGIPFVTSQSGTDQIQAAVRTFFTAAGVDLSATLNKVVVFNDRRGTLTIRATPDDLDIIEQAIQTMNTAPPEVNIKTKFIEITQNDSRGFGINLTLGGIAIGRGGATVVNGGTAPSLTGAPSAVNPIGLFPGTTNTPPGSTTLISTLTAPATSDGILTSGLRNQQNAPAIATITGILTDPQFRAVINALEQRDGTSVLTAPEVTTESGRQAQMQAVDIQQIVTGSGLTTGGTTAATGTTGGTIAGATTPAFNPTTTTLSFGPELDVVPYISADEFSIQMALIPSVTDFVGYDNPGQFVPQASVPTGGTITSVLPLPHFRLRQVVTSVTVWDAQTVAIGGLMTDSVASAKDKVPMLGDLPFLGRLFRSESSLKSKKNLMIFVTSTIVNPDGTRYHTDEELPFLVTGPVASKSSDQ